MIATHTQQNPRIHLPFNPATDSHTHPEPETHFDLIEHGSQTPLLLPGRITMHHPKAGLNPLVDSAGYLFSILGKLKKISAYRQLGSLQQQLIREIHSFQKNIQHHGYNAEYTLICQYIICAAFDDILSNTAWGGQGQWDNFSLLKAFKQEQDHHHKFFNILEHAVKDPALYIDLMEFIYICLSLGYKGPYRATEYNHYQLEQITHNLYKHIRAYRGNANRTLSPVPLKPNKSIRKSTSQGYGSLLTMAIVTACIVMATFVSLGYLMDVISNESLESIAQVKPQTSLKTST